ncbi:MAG: helicase HerA-like domain-containing protein, partial [Sulfobacillus sp.]
GGLIIMSHKTRLPLGLDTTTRKTLWIGNDALNLSCCVFGATGSGKTSTLNHFARHAMRSGMPLILIDAKGDAGWALALHQWAKAEDRPFFQWSVRGPTLWNPLEEGSPSELKDKLMGLTDWTEPHYRYAGERFLQTLIQCFQVSGHPLTLDALVTHGDNPRALMNLARESGPSGERLLAIVDQWDTDGSLRKAVIGLMTRLAVLSESDAGPYLSGSGIRLRNMLIDPHAPVVLFSLPKLQYSGLVPLLGALIIQDLKAAIAALYREVQRTAAMILIDEFGAFATLQALDILAQARGAGMHSIVASQDPLDYAHTAPELPLQVLGLL